MKRYLLALCWVWLCVSVLHAQENPVIITLRSPATDWQTGQPYPLQIEITQAVEVWLVDLTLRYDPAQVYIMGTLAGSPVQVGGFFPLDNALTLRNVATRTGMVGFTQSLVAPANPVSGVGLLGTLTVYPLQAGQVEITVASAQITRVNFTTSANGERVGQSAQDLPFAVAPLNQMVTGDTVQPPSEVTATPSPTATPDAALQLPEATTAPATEIPLVTAAPALATPTPAPVAEASTDGPPILLLGGALVLLAVLGLGGLWWWSRRR